MKTLILRTMLILGMVMGYGVSYSQTSLVTCAKKGTADCPIVNCPKKGTKDCPYTASFASLSSNSAKADCPLKGTPDCPLIKNCPQKGTADCPLIKKESLVSYAAKTTSAKKKNDADFLACCRKEAN